MPRRFRINAALERKRDDEEACGEIETAHPGYLGAQDTFYVGTLKGGGRIYQQTFMDAYSKWAAAKLYTAKTAITAADLLNDRGPAVLRATAAAGPGEGDRQRRIDTLGQTVPTRAPVRSSRSHYT